MNKKILSTANVLRFAVMLSALVLSACAGTAAPGASSSAASAIDALAGVSIAALPQLGEIFYTGAVQAISDSSLQVADLTFRVDGHTSWAQDLTVGSPVRVRALALPDQTHYAVDVQSAAGLASAAGEVTFSLRDVIVSIGDASWQIGDQTVLVDAGTQIGSGLMVGDAVQVEGVVVNGALLARSILADDGSVVTPVPSASPTVEVSSTVEVTPTVVPAGQTRIELTGELNAIDAASLQVSGLTFAITAETELKGTLQAGDIVKVEGLRALDGSLTALEVKLAEETGQSGTSKAEIQGVVESISGNLWVIGGFNVMVDSTTAISSGLIVGDSVKVEGVLQADGSLLASEIKSAGMDEDRDGDNDEDQNEDSDHDGQSGDATRVEFSGTVESINGSLWVIAGRTVTVTARTEISGSPQVGDYVKVEAYDSNGTLNASEIKAKSTQSGGDDQEEHIGTGTPESGDDHHEDEHSTTTSTPQPGGDDGGEHEGGGSHDGGDHDGGDHGDD